MNIRELSNKALIDELQTRLKTEIKEEIVKAPVEDKKIFEVPCTICGEMTKVPFMPPKGYPTKCYECFQKTKGK